MANRVLKAHGSRVQSGLFRGMSCITDADEGCLVPKLLGTYEEELAPAFESLLAKPYDVIIDVGCASGFWLCGLALRTPGAKALGFDISPEALKRCRQMVALNNLEGRVQLNDRCTFADFERLVAGRTLVFMDIDGPEYELLDPGLAPSLLRADIVVECHDYLNSQILPTLIQRFGPSHSIERISSRVRTPSSEMYPGLKALPVEHWAAALDERRPAVQDWLVMRSNWPSREDSGRKGDPLAAPHAGAPHNEPRKSSL